MSDTDEKRIEEVAPVIDESRYARFRLRARSILCILGVLFVIMLFRWLTDALLDAPSGMLMAWACAAALASFIFKRKGFNAVVLIFLATVMWYPVVHILITSKTVFVIFCILTALIFYLLRNRERAWALTGYLCFFLWLLALLANEALVPGFAHTISGQAGKVEGLRRLDGMASVIGSDEQIDLTNLRPTSLLLSSNDLRLYASYADKDISGIAAISLTNKPDIVFRKLGGEGAFLYQNDKYTGSIFAGDMAKGDITELSYDKLEPVRSYGLTTRPINTAVIDVRGDMIIAPDFKNDEIKLFTAGENFKKWASFKSGGFFFRLFPKTKKQLLPGAWSLRKMIADNNTRRLFIVYGVSRNIVVMGLDERNIIKVDRTAYPFTSDAAIDTAHNTLFLAKPLGIIEYYNTSKLAVERRLHVVGGIMSIGYDPLRDMIVAANYYTGILYFIDRSSGRTVSRIAVGKGIRKLAVSPLSGKVYLVYEFGILEFDPSKFDVPDSYGKSDSTPGKCCGGK